MARVILFYLMGDAEAERQAVYLVESGQKWDVDNKWSVRMDRAHAPGLKDHVHVLLKGKRVSVINKDGSPSHGTDRSGVPNWLITKMKARNLIEGQLMVEASGARLTVPAHIIESAEFRSRISDALPQRG